MAQQYTERFANNVASPLAAALTAGATTLTVLSVTGPMGSFPTLGQFRVVVDNEVMLVTAVSGTTFTVTRGYEGTTAAAHAAGVEVGLVLTTAALESVGGYPADGRLTGVSGQPLGDTAQAGSG